MMPRTPRISGTNRNLPLWGRLGLGLLSLLGCWASALLVAGLVQRFHASMGLL